MSGLAVWGVPSMFRPVAFAFGILYVTGSASYAWDCASPELTGQQEESGRWAK